MKKFKSNIYAYAYQKRQPYSLSELRRIVECGNVEQSAMAAEAIRAKKYCSDVPEYDIHWMSIRSSVS